MSVMDKYFRNFRGLSMPGTQVPTSFDMTMYQQAPNPSPYDPTQGIQLPGTEFPGSMDNSPYMDPSMEDVPLTPAAEQAMRDRRMQMAQQAMSNAPQAQAVDMSQYASAPSIRAMLGEGGQQESSPDGPVMNSYVQRLLSGGM